MSLAVLWVIAVLSTRVDSTQYYVQQLLQLFSSRWPDVLAFRPDDLDIFAPGSFDERRLRFRGHEVVIPCRDYDQGSRGNLVYPVDSVERVAVDEQ